MAKHDDNSAVSLGRSGDIAPFPSRHSLAPEPGRFTSVLDWQQMEGITIDRQALAMCESSLPSAPVIAEWPNAFRFPNVRYPEMTSKIVELYPDILEGRVRILENAVLVVTDFVKSTALVRELEHQGIGVTTHFNQLLSELCQPIKLHRGYPIGFHGDSVHALFPAASGLTDAHAACFAMGHNWMAKTGGLIPALRIGVAIGRIELGLLGAADDCRIEIMGSAVHAAFRAASGHGYLRCHHPMAQLFLTESMMTGVPERLVIPPTYRNVA
jgi:hypothetical protein